jgi:hypothetical protein
MASALDKFHTTGNTQVNRLLLKHLARLGQDSPQALDLWACQGNQEQRGQVRHPFAGVRVWVPAFVQPL